MTENRFEQLTALYERARELEPDQREAFLDEACTADLELRAELARMLAVDEQAPEFLDRPDEPDEPPASRTPDRIGPYRVVRTIGTGGMGVVYEALQENPARRVALKMLRFGFDSESLARRFRYEVEVLARLNHPGIAKVHDAGVHATPDGAEVPYFAMEFVEGATDLVSYGQRERLTLDQRLELFLAVCDAVRHGHQLGVVHRDLKPANVLVGADGRPKVIDFGVARAVGEGEAHTQATRTGEIVGTLTRMSPEQLSGDPELVDTRTDVYALGLLLYEMICGRLPYDVEGRSWTDVARVIRDEAPRDPSRVDGSIPRDLGWVVLRALEKERERRYPSVSELAADLERFRSDEPVLAGPPSGLYQARKFLRRHRLAVGAAAVVLVSLVAGTTLAVLGMLRARDAEALAKEDAARARTMRDLTTGVFESVNLYRFGADVRMVEVLRAAALESEHLADQPQLEAEFRAMLGDSFISLGDSEEAREHFERALEVYRAAFGPDAPATLRLQRGLASALNGLGRRDEALRIVADVIERSERILGPDDEETLRARIQVAVSLLPPGSEEKFEAMQEVAPLALAAFGPADLKVLDLTLELAFALADQGRNEEALAQADDVVRSLEARVSPEEPRLLFARRDRGILMRLNGDLEGCEREFDAIAPAWRLRLGPQSRHTGDLMMELAKVKRFLDHHEEAEAIVRRELDVRLPLTGDAGEHTSILLYELGELLLERGEFDEAEECFWRAIDGCGAFFGESNIRTLVARAALTRLWSRLGREEDAAAMLHELIEDTERAYGPDSRMLIEFLVLLAQATRSSGSDESLAHAARATRIARATLPPANPARTSALDMQARLTLQTGDPDAAEPLLLELLETLPDIPAQAEVRREAAQSLVELYERRDDEAAAARFRALLGSD